VKTRIKTKGNLKKVMLSIDEKMIGLFVFELTFFLLCFQPIRKKPISKTSKYFFIVTIIAFLAFKTIVS